MMPWVVANHASAAPRCATVSSAMRRAHLVERGGRAIVLFRVTINCATLCLRLQVSGRPLLNSALACATVAYYRRSLLFLLRVLVQYLQDLEEQKRTKYKINGTATTSRR